MKEYLILDGYNVINAWPDLKKLLEESLETARVELIERMAEYQAFKGQKVIIVFDAHMVKGSMNKSNKLKGVEIVFTKERETADAYIEKMTMELSKKNRVFVVTNDWTEQQMVLGGGAVRLSVRELVLEFTHIKSKIHYRIEKNRKQKELLSDRIDEDILQKLEKFRRGQ